MGLGQDEVHGMRNRRGGGERGQISIDEKKKTWATNLSLNVGSGASCDDLLSSWRRLQDRHLAASLHLLHHGQVHRTRFRNGDDRRGPTREWSRRCRGSVAHVGPGKRRTSKYQMSRPPNSKGQIFTDINGS